MMQYRICWKKRIICFFCNIFNITSEQFNVSLLNESIISYKKTNKQKYILKANFWMAVCVHTSNVMHYTHILLTSNKPLLRRNTWSAYDGVPLRKLSTALACQNLKRDMEKCQTQDTRCLLRNEEVGKCKKTLQNVTKDLTWMKNQLALSSWLRLTV